MQPKRQRPFQVDRDEYPFESHWFERDAVAMHYVDEGKGVPVLLLHGNPTWSFLYRKVIKGLKGSCRVIAPDYPGFGFSEHPPDFGYTPQEHAEWIKALMAHLNLDLYILVVQDWGGPIGLSIAAEQPDRIAGLVICNTWCWPATPKTRLFSCVMGGPLGKHLILKHNFFAKVLVPFGIHNDRAMIPPVLRAYADPFPTAESRMGNYVFPRQIRKAASWLRSIEQSLPRLADKPVRMVWGMKDPAFGTSRVIRRWKAFFPGASVTRVSSASHYLQEDCPEQIVTAIRHVIDQLGKCESTRKSK
ncbi:MAG: alpha/beta fold hydrolase [candidate division Zixibacteria bacterium]|nr:alpha/beta fold hydrolase [candidate division Zixibacteria bacterium]